MARNTKNAGAAIVEKTTRSNKGAQHNPTNGREPSPYDPLWINFGLMIENSTVEVEEGEDLPLKFIRANRGVAVSDLKETPVYAGQSDQFKAENRTMNALIREIRKRGLELEAGESVELNVTVMLYHRQETEEVSDQTEEDYEAAVADVFGS